MRLKHLVVGLLAAGLLTAGAALPATANHGPNCDESSREGIIEFLSQDNNLILEWGVYDRDGDGVACDNVHDIALSEISDSTSDDDMESSDDEVTVEAPTTINTGR